MEFYRAYAQPNQPDHFRVFGFDVAKDDNVPYSAALKAACKKWAGPMPPRPMQCPRCHVANASFAPNLCYKVGIAGAWNFLCFSCHKVHIPSQQGPSNEGLEDIETIRACDHEDFLDRKAKKATKRAKARAIARAKGRAKADQEEPNDEVATSGASSIPFGLLNNDAVLLDVATSGSGGHEILKVEKTEIDNIPRGPANYYMKGTQSQARNIIGAEDNPRTVELVFWARNQEPLVDRVPVRFDHELFLYEFAYFRNMKGLCVFECYAFEASLWCNLPFNMSPIHIGSEDDVIFIRAWGVRCNGFGRLLERYQHRHGLALNPALGIRATVDIPPPRHQWLVIWGRHGGAPEMHLFNLDLANGLDDDTRLALPWAHLISDAHFLLIWRETESAWAAVGRGISSGVIEAPITLVAHPLAENLAGSGEAIAWLEEWRFRGSPRSRATTPSDNKAGSAKRELSAVPEPRARLAITAPINANNLEFGAVSSVGPSVRARSSGDVSALRSITRSDGRAPLSPPMKHRAPYPSSPGLRLLDESASAAHAARRARASKRPASASSDEELVFLSGPLAPQSARRPAKMGTSAASPDAVEVLDGPPPAQEPRRSSKRRRVITSIDARVLLPPAPSSKRPLAVLTSALPDDDVVLIDKPSAELIRRFAKKAAASAPSNDVLIIEDHPAAGPSRARPSSTESQSRQESSRSATISDDEVEFVEEGSIAAKRRSSNVNGRQVIDLT